MKKLLGLLLVMGLAFFIWRMSSDQSKNNVAAAYQYSLQPLSQIHVIEINEPGKEQVILSRSGGDWILNDKFIARPNAMENLLTAIGNIELQFIPQEAGKQTIRKVLQQQGIDITIKDRDGDVLKAYTIGGVTPDERGTFILLDGFEEPGVVSIPGFDGSLIPRFRMSAKDWRDRTVLSVAVDDIDTLRLDYGGQPTQSFEIRRSRGGWALFPLRGAIDQSVLVQEGMIESYLRHYRKLSAEDIIEDQDLRQALGTREPFASLMIATRGGNHHWARFYPISVAPDAPALAKITRFHVMDEHENIFLVQHRLFEEIFRGYEHFVARN